MKDERIIQVPGCVVERELLVTFRLLLLLLSRSAPHRCKSVFHEQFGLANAFIDARTGGDGIALLGPPTHLFKGMTGGVTLVQQLFYF